MSVSAGDDLIRRADLEAIIGKVFLALKASKHIIFYYGTTHSEKLLLPTEKVCQ